GKNASRSADTMCLGRLSGPITGSTVVRAGAMRHQPRTRGSFTSAATPPPNGCCLAGPPLDGSDRGEIIARRAPVPTGGGRHSNEGGGMTEAYNATDGSSAPAAAGRRVFRTELNPVDFLRRA